MFDLMGCGMLSCRDRSAPPPPAAKHAAAALEAGSLRSAQASHVHALRFVMELIAVSIENQFRMLFGSDTAPYDIRMGMAPPAHHARYATLGPAHSNFDERAMPAVTLVLDSALLDRPLPMAAPSRQ